MHARSMFMQTPQPGRYTTVDRRVIAPAKMLQ
jgi:hypothetical protein